MMWFVCTSSCHMTCFGVTLSLIDGYGVCVCVCVCGNTNVNMVFSPGFGYP